MIIFCLSLLECSSDSSPKFKVGQYITNDYCYGQIACVAESLEQYKLMNAICGENIYNVLYIQFNDAKEYKQRR